MNAILLGNVDSTGKVLFFGQVLSTCEAIEAGGGNPWGCAAPAPRGPSDGDGAAAWEEEGRGAPNQAQRQGERQRETQAMRRCFMLNDALTLP